VLKQKLESRPI